MTTLRVRYGETDQMGVVYHSNYFRYFEVARSDYYRDLGFAYQRLEAQGIMLPLITCQASFRMPARYDDELVIAVKLKSLSAVRLTLTYHVTRKVDGELLVTGTTEHAFTSTALKPLSIKKHQPDFYALLAHQLEQVG